MKMYNKQNNQQYIAFLSFWNQLIIMFIESTINHICYLIHLQIRHPRLEITYNK